MSNATSRVGWRRPSYCGSGEECFDVDFTDLGVELRHSTQPDGHVFFFTDTEWNRFCAEISAQNITDTNGAVRTTPGDPSWTVEEIRTGHVLTFTPAEVRDFRLAVTAGEFDPVQVRAQETAQAS